MFTDGCFATSVTERALVGEFLSEIAVITLCREIFIEDERNHKQTVYSISVSRHFFIYCLTGYKLFDIMPVSKIYFVPAKIF